MLQLSRCPGEIRLSFAISCKNPFKLLSLVIPMLNNEFQATLTVAYFHQTIPRLYLPFNTLRDQFIFLPLILLLCGACFWPKIAKRRQISNFSRAQRPNTWCTYFKNLTLLFFIKYICPSFLTTIKSKVFLF